MRGFYIDIAREIKFMRVGLELVGGLSSNTSFTNK
jgi:hypothetical protein